jgi:hypothetical protein
METYRKDNIFVLCHLRTGEKSLWDLYYQFWLDKHTCLDFCQIFYNFWGADGFKLPWKQTDVTLSKGYKFATKLIFMSYWNSQDFQNKNGSFVKNIYYKINLYVGRVWQLKTICSSKIIKNLTKIQRGITPSTTNTITFVFHFVLKM